VPFTSESALRWFCGGGVNVVAPDFPATVTGKPAAPNHP